MEKDDIKYKVLSALGYVERPDFVQSDDNAVRIVNDEYEHYLSLAVTSAKWNFFIARTQLQYTEDEGKYKYKYELPEDVELVNNAYSDDKYSYALRDYEVINGYLYTDSNKCFIEYRKKVCEGNLPSYFIEYLRLYMAYNLCQLITGDSDLEKSLASRYLVAFNNACALDNMQKPARILDSGIYTSVRG